MSTPKKILNGLELLQALSAAVGQMSIKWLDIQGSLLGRVEWGKALEIAKAGRYSGKVAGPRVVYIRELEVKSEIVMDTHYRDDMPVLQPYSIGHERLGSLKAQMLHMESAGNRRPLQLQAL